MQSGARGGREEERRDTAGEKSIVNATRKTRGAKNEPGRTIKGDGRGNGRDGGGGDGLRSSCWVRATIVSGTTLPSSARAAGRGRARLAHYSKSGMQSRAAASADNNFLGRTFFVAEFSRQQFSPFSSFSRTLPSDSDRSLLAPLKLHFGYCAAEAPRAGGSGGDGRWRGERKRGEGGTKGTAPRGGESSANGRRVSQSESNGGGEERKFGRETDERTDCRREGGGYCYGLGSMADISLEMVSLGRGRGGMKEGRRIAYRKAPISAWLRRRLMGMRERDGSNGRLRRRPHESDTHAACSWLTKLDFLL